MVQANDLRVGNWILDMEDGRIIPKQVKGVCFASEKKKYDGFTAPFIQIFNGTTLIDEDCIQPIPLTEEILAKIGFTNPDEQLGYWEYDGIELWKDETGFYNINSSLINHIDSVHKLQNWYYFNTDEELNITF